MNSYNSCAKIEDNIVTQVIACRNVRWAVDKLGGEWLPVFESNPAGIGYTWNGEEFVAPLVLENDEEVE